MTWRYEFLSQRQHHSDLRVLDGGEFPARDADDAKLVLASVMRNISVPADRNPMRSGYLTYWAAKSGARYCSLTDTLTPNLK